MTAGAGRQTPPGAAGPPRVPALDLARSAALAGMVVFHLVRDLEMFGIVAPGTTLSGGWPVFARLVAGSFLLLSGMSLALAHGAGPRWGPFLRRLGILALAAGLVSAATTLAVPDRFVSFGILHAIAAASLCGMLVVRRPPWVAGLAALGVMVLFATLGRSLDLPLWLGWTGLAAETRPALDFVPLIPWLAPCLLGIMAAKLVLRPGQGPGQEVARPGTPLLRALTWPGRHSLAIYLVHQPILLGGIWVLVWLAERP